MTICICLLDASHFKFAQMLPEENLINWHPSQGVNIMADKTEQN